MQQLYNDLMQPRLNDKGKPKAPSSLHLRAARALKQADETNTTNVNLIMQLQRNNQELLEQLRIVNESLHEARRQVSNVGGEQQDGGTSDSSSEAGVQAEGSSPSIDGAG